MVVLRGVVVCEDDVVPKGVGAGEDSKLNVHRKCVLKTSRNMCEVKVRNILITTRSEKLNI